MLAIKAWIFSDCCSIIGKKATYNQININPIREYKIRELNNKSASLELNKIFKEDLYSNFLRLLETGKLEIAAEQDEITSQLKTMRQGQLVTPSASPTFLINGKTYEGGRDAESMKKALCALFDSAPEECSEELSASSDAPQGNC